LALVPEVQTHCPLLLCLAYFTDYRVYTRQGQLIYLQELNYCT